MSRFKRAAQLNLFGFVAFVAVSLLIAFLVVTLREQLRIDACLDSGGSYDYDAGRCDHRESHPSPW